MIRAESPTIRVAAGFLILLGAVAAINPHTVITVAAWCAISLVLGAAIFGTGESSRVLRAFLFYSAAAISLYLIQRMTLPEYEGFTGMPGIGTDDSYFFALAVREVSHGLSAELSSWRPSFFLFSHNYSDALGVFARVIRTLVGPVHPLDLIYCNVAIMALLPSAVARTAQALLEDDRVGRVIWWIVLLCPFIAANSVILIRDGLTAVAFALALLGVVERRLMLVVVSVACVAYLRFMQAGLLIASLWIILLMDWILRRDLSPRGQWRGVALLSLPAVGLLAALAVLPTAVANVDVLLSLLFREGFLEGWIFERARTDQGTSTFYAISQMPLPIRLPLAFAFYFGVPHLVVDELVMKPIFVPRDYMHAAFSIAFIAYTAYFVRGVFRAWCTNNALLFGIACAYLMDILVISQASMQVRHKVALMPMFYLVVAAGLKSAPSRVRTVSLIAAALVGAFDIVFSGYKLWRFPS